MRALRIAAAALALLAACSQAKAPEPRALLWKVSDADNSVYLLGSFHALKPDDYPLPATVQAAFADAERLAFEVPPGEMESPQLMQQLLKLSGDRSLIQVEDDGLGMTEERLKEALDGGIGLSNVNERLRTIYGASCTLKLSSESGRGTSVSVEIPDLTVAERIPA